jgi:hypothetical protein
MVPPPNVPAAQIPVWPLASNATVLVFVVIGVGVTGTMTAIGTSQKGILPLHP